MKFVHASDLHLSAAEADYGLAVLAELGSLAQERGARALILSGDLFDTEADLASLYPRFRRELERVSPEVAIVAISGNHDRLRGKGDLGRFDFGKRIAFVHAESAAFRLSGAGGEPGLEILAFPYGTDLSAAAFPEPEATQGRVLVCHGSVPELNWLGPEAEEGEGPESLLDTGRLLALKPAYVALGHIHQGAERRLGESLFAYPGSCRVWRRGETGPRTALLVSLSAAEGGAARATTEALTLKSAGTYREIGLALDAEGNLPAAELEAIAREAGSADWLDISLSGVAQREEDLNREVEAARERLGTACRRAEINAEGVIFLGQDAGCEAARVYRQRWEAAREALEREHGKEATLRALEVGLEAIYRARGDAK
jgi:DNA repair exonuclease SbcCD nuclease subunit